jgi:RNA polymerase sigma-70 factor (ECF subfamily)
MKPERKMPGDRRPPSGSDDEPLASAPASRQEPDLHRDDLALARAATDGDTDALGAVDALITRSDRALGRLGLDAPQRDDVLQELRLALLVPGEGGGRGLAKYAGTGSLAGWIAVCALNLGRRRAARARPAGDPDDDTWAASATAGDLELEYMRRLYGAEFRSAFEEAFAALTTRQRNLLRYTVLDGLIADQVAAIYRVHRTTIARELSRTRKDLLVRTRGLLATRLGLSASDVESLLVLIQSQLHVTLERLVRQGPLGDTHR